MDPSDKRVVKLGVVVREEGSAFNEEDLLPISALQHLVFCERQCALIHIERVWRDNPLTVEGTHVHRRVDESGPRRELRGDLMIVRGVPLRSFRLGLSGRADVVEFHRYRRDPSEAPGVDRLAPAIPLSKVDGLWVPFPVDYKRGRPKPDLSDEIQLCAQGLCLEEMLVTRVTRAALFYGRLRHRHEVVLDDTLRVATVQAAARLRALISSGVTPRAIKQPKCRRCSLIEVCKPEAMSRGRSARRYLAQGVEQALGEEV
jgi:CRISPR-associated exonuclease Cas4